MADHKSATWQQEEERGSLLGIQFLLWTSQYIGRSAVHFCLFFICLFFVIVAPKPRQASKTYLKRVLGKTPNWTSIFSHFYYFARISTDRFFFLRNQMQKFHITVEGEKIFDQLDENKKGALLILSHVGSFDVLRILGKENIKSKIRILLDTQVNPKAMLTLNKINPEMAANIIDRARYDGNSLALKLDEEIQQGHLVGIMGDRIYGEQRTISHNLLGEAAAFPLSPWYIAQLLKVPVIVCFGIFLGGNRYHLKFISLPTFKKVPRQERMKQLQNLSRQYVAELEQVIKQHPYNWLNFYEFWA